MHGWNGIDRSTILLRIAITSSGRPALADSPREALLFSEFAGL
jgi:hypothetical protein